MFARAGNDALHEEQALIHEGERGADLLQRLQEFLVFHGAIIGA